MRKIVAGKLQTGADFEGSKWGCVCSGSTAVQTLIMQDRRIA